MKKNKRWIAVTALAGVTAVALIASVVVKNNLKKEAGEVIAITQTATDLGVKKVEVIKGNNGEVTGYKVNVEAKGFGATPMELLVSFNANADTVTEVEVISHSETEGFGSLMTEAQFLDQFKNVKLPVYIEGMSVSANDVLQVLSLANKDVTSVTPMELKDGVYEVKGEPDAKGYTSQVTLTVEGGKITAVVWDNVTADGKLKSIMSQNGEYVMTEDGPTWFEQAQLLAQNVIENQGVSALTMDEKGKTDAVASVSITIDDFVAQVQEAMIMAASQSSSQLNDGVFEVVGKEPHNGYTSKVTVTVSGGKITEVVWDCFDAEGKLKSIMSQNGEYVMTENGPTWFEQAQILAQNVIENQGVSALTMDEKGKPDAVASVSITISEFVAQVEEALVMSANAKQEEVSALKDGVFEVVGKEPHNGYTSKVTVTVSGGKITEVVWDCFDAEGKLKSIMSQNGEYVMTENGPTWFEQAQLLAQNVIENQGVSALIMDEKGKTDAVASVSITISEFVAQVEEALVMSANGITTPVSSLKDGVYEIEGEQDAKGYTSLLTLTVEGGKITSVVWDCRDAEGKLKSIMSQNGEYVMTENGPTWYEQAQLLAQNVIENQGISALTMDESGKTDAVASVSIVITDFVNQVEQALYQASGQEAPVVEEPVVTEPVDGTKVDAISGATVTTKAFLTAINNAYEYLVNNVVK